MANGLQLGLLQDLGLLLQPQQLALVGEDLTSALQYHLEALASAHGVLLEALDGELLNAVLDLLPAATQGRDLGALGEGRLRVGRRCRRVVDASLADVDQVGPGQVHRAQRDGAVLGVDVRRLVDVRCVLAAEYRVDPLGR